MSDLYPQELWQLHSDLDYFAYGKKEKNEDEESVGVVMDRLPSSLANAEQSADTMLIEFLRKKIKEIGSDEYKRLLTKATTETSKTLYALRCFVASSRLYQENPDIIEILKGDVDLRSLWRQIEETDDGPLITDEVDSEKPYERAMIHVEERTKIMEIRTTKKPSKIDELPIEMLPGIQAVLGQRGLEVTEENAWKMLDSMSHEASIDDRIIARILYLMTNASFQKEQAKLSNK